MSATRSAPLLINPGSTDGTLTIGETPAGDPVSYRLTRHYRAESGLVVGGAGAGINNLLTVLAIQARASDIPVATVYIDGSSDDDRRRNHALHDAATVSLHDADVAEASITALEAAVTARAQHLRERGMAPYEAAGFPVLLVLIKDAPALFEARAKRWNRVLLQTGALGIAVVAAVPNLLSYSFGTSMGRIVPDRGSASLRSALLSTLMVLRTYCWHTDQELRYMVEGCASSMPNEAGQGQLIRDRVARRFESYWLSTTEDPAEIEHARRQWLRRYPDNTLDTPTRDAIQHVLSSRN